MMVVGGQHGTAKEQRKGERRDKAQKQYRDPYITDQQRHKEKTEAKIMSWSRLLAGQATSTWLLKDSCGQFKISTEEITAMFAKAAPKLFAQRRPDSGELATGFSVSGMLLDVIKQSLATPSLSQAGRLYPIGDA